MGGLGICFAICWILGSILEQIKLLKRFKSIRESLSSSDWKFDIQSAQAPYPSDVKNRKKCIKVFLGAGLHEAALVLLQDFVCNSKLEATFARDYVVKDKFKLTFPFKPKNLTFKSGENTDLRWLRAFICVNIYPADPYVAARIVLREFLTTDNDSSELQEYQLLVIKTLQETASNLDEAERSAMLRRLLDLPGVDRGDLFRNPKAKKLLGSAFPELLKSDGGTLGPLCALEMHYQEILWKSMKRLTEKFVLGGETPDQLEILARSPYTPISADSIDLFLDLADAATYCAGQVNTAIGVLKFLASREELSDKQKQRIIALCDQIKMAVRFDPDPKIAESFDSVVEKTDANSCRLAGAGERRKEAGRRRLKH